MSTVSIVSPAPELVIAAGITLPVLCSLAVTLRLINSRRIDDWLTIPSLVLLWGQGICLVYGTVKHALGYFPSDAPQGVDPDTYVNQEAILASEILYAMLLMQIPCLTLIKLSFVLFYRRIFLSRATQSKYLAITLNTLIGLLVLWVVGFWFAQLFVCGTNFSLIFFGTNDQQAAACLPFTPFDQALAASDFVLDLMIYILPIPLVLKLNISKGKKWGLLGVFSLGALAIAASITRFIVFTYDDIMGFTICLYWTCLESGIALLTSCLPSIYGLYNNKRRTHASRSGGSSGWSDPRTLLGKSRSRLYSNSSQTQDSKLDKGRQDEIRVTQTIMVDREGISMEDLVPRGAGNRWVA